MKALPRTARPRRVAALTGLGLAAAGAVVAACVLLHGRADALRGAQLDLLRLRGNVGVMQALPRTARDERSLARVAAELRRRARTNRLELTRLARFGERDELGPARRLDGRNLGFLLQEAGLLAGRRETAAEQLAGRFRPSVDREFRLLRTAERGLGNRADRAEAVAEIAAVASVALALAVCALLFRRLVRSNRAAVSARAFAESLIESSVDGVLAYGLDGRYEVWNRACEKLTGIDRGAIIGRLPHETPLALAGGALAARAAALAGETVELRDEQLELPGLGRRTFDIVYGPLHDSAGRIAGGIAHVRDVTERNKLEHGLREAQKLEAIGQLAGGIAHDFNNLLMGISGHAALALERGGAGDERLRASLEEIRRAAAHGGALTEQLLFFARRGERPDERVELNAVVRDAAALLERLLEPGIAIELDLGEPSWVDGDPAQLGQVVLNLGTNARDAMPDGGTLRISTRPIGAEYVQLAVADSGCGIPDDVKGRVFEPFFTTKPLGQGTGLGLASVYGIVTQCGGSIELESEVGRGTTFTITLQAAQPPAAAAPGGPARATVLLVEDEPVVRRLVAAGLEDQGHAVVVAPTPAAALAYVEQGGTFDVLVTDLVMPGLGGGELARRLREEVAAPFGIVYVSGYPAAGFTLDERSAFLPKPFELAELYELVQRLLPVLAEQPR
ncbi:MAG TPA: ATP-binding protein [Gaiellaceae bacterium]|nr:ATP-binding protein [Gaiellaceae bacterium]